MSRFFSYKLSFLIVSLLLTSCATYNAQYNKDSKNWNTQNKEQNLEVAHTFYLIGDAGNATEGEFLTHFNLLKEEISSSQKNTTVLFLGDNIYKKGMSKKNHPKRKLAEHRLDAQLNLVKNFKGKTIFIPGNHDYYNNGIKGLKRQENYIIKKLQDKNAFLPRNGCPLKKVTISNDIVLLIIDSQWYLENWNNNPTMNDKCEIKTRESFFEEFESLIKKNTSKTILIAMHHPMFSYGAHGGQFSFKQQFYPTSNKIPMPILGTIANVLRTTTGISPQDMLNPFYQELKKRLVTISQRAERVVFVSGHEHNLQYIFKDNIPQIISGSGSKISPARILKGSKFAYGKLGYAKLIVYTNGASWVYYYSEINGEKKLLFKTEIYTNNKTDSIYKFQNNFPKKITTSIYTAKETSKGKLFTAFWGKHYRKYYSTKILAPTVQLDTLFGGLTPVRKGGGFQSKSLRLKDKNGKEYVMRALRKSATQFLQAALFKTQYIGGVFDNTYTESLLLDIYTTAHPYTPLAIGTLASASSIYHTNPTLYYVPKQNALKHFNKDFGNELYLIEERATSGHGNLKSFGFSNKLISTTDLLRNLQKSDAYYVDEDAYIRARLFDMLIGDWDRHQDQWRWAEFKVGTKKMYKPVPRDRDQAFSKYDGFFMGFLTRTIPVLKSKQKYGKKIRNIKWFNSSPYPLDMAILKNYTLKNWENQVAFLQQNITDEVIENAFKQLPNEVNTETITAIKTKLKNRLKNLSQIAETYYKHLSKFAVITGTNTSNWFEIERLNNGKTSVKIFNSKSEKKEIKIFDKLYAKEHTKEIWVYGLDGKDTFKVTGNNKNTIPLRIIGGQNNDTYNIKNGKRVTIYDFKTQKNTFKTTKGKRKLFNNYKANVYNYKKLKYNQNQLIPTIGSNPDDGLKIGIKNIFTVYGFERNPFTQQHTLKAAYYFATNGFDIKYNAEFASIFNQWNFLLETHFTSPNFSTNYYGFGNKTNNKEKEFGANYHRVKISTYNAFPSLKWIGRMGASFKIGGSIESIEVENTPNRFINTTTISTGKRKNYAGFRASYFYENYDNNAFPTLGMSISLETGWKTNINNSNENNSYIKPSIGITYKLISSGKIVVATKLKGTIINGGNFEFYNAASIGGNNGLRGYRNQRFIGNKSFYQNTDIRFNLRNVKTELLPLQIGLFGGFDYGRVWLKNEKSTHWKTSYGAGFWVTAAEMINFNASVFNSNDGTYFNFGLGFEF